MKKYKTFIFENLDVTEYQQNYNSVKDSLLAFWDNLEDSVDEFGTLDSRNPNSVFNFNETERKKREQRIRPTKKQVVKTKEVVPPKVDQPTKVEPTKVEPEIAK